MNTRLPLYLAESPAGQDEIINCLNGSGAVAVALSWAAT